MSTQVTAMGLTQSGGIVAATKSGFSLFDPASGELQPITGVLDSQGPLRFNDGAIGPLGRFWAGTMNDLDHYSPDGELFCLHPDGSVAKIETGFTVSNGIGWSPDRRIMYFTDTRPRTIYAYDYDSATGEVSHRRDPMSGLEMHPVTRACVSTLGCRK